MIAYKTEHDVPQYQVTNPEVEPRGAGAGRAVPLRAPAGARKVELPAIFAAEAPAGADAPSAKAEEKPVEKQEKKP